MFPSLEAKWKRFAELERQLEDPAVQSDTGRLLAIQREYGGLSKVGRAVQRFHDLEGEIAAAREMLAAETDPDVRAYAEDEIRALDESLSALRKDLEDLVTAGDSISVGSLIMEVRAGTGGDEAALFAGEVFDMYKRYCEGRGWKIEIFDASPGEMGGFKEVVFSVTGEGAFHRLQFESGGHRVQRVPKTESQGRIHTSAATVAVMPEATEVEVDIRDEDVQVDTMRAGGPGGQKVNKTESAVRLTHLPTGIVVKCQDEKSQHKNRAKAMRELRSRVYQKMLDEQQAQRARHRRTLIGSGDRSERIRTYNFPQGRITDHRIGLTIYKIDQVMLGDLDELIDGLLEFDRMERLNQIAETGEG